MVRKTFKGYYNTGETLQKLGVSKDVLYLYVRNGRIEPYIPQAESSVFGRKSKLTS